MLSTNSKIAIKIKYSGKLVVLPGMSRQGDEGDVMYHVFVRSGIINLLYCVGCSPLFVYTMLIVVFFASPNPT